jgi:hypothetical protein
MLNNALDAAALARMSFGHTASVLAQVAPQFAIQAARLVQEAFKNSRGKLEVAAVLSPENARLKEALTAEADNRGMNLPDGDTGEAPQIQKRPLKLAYGDQDEEAPQIQKRPLKLAYGDQDEEAPQMWGSLGEIEFDLVSSPNGLSFN